MILLRRDRLLPGAGSAPPGTSVRISVGIIFPDRLLPGDEVRPLYDVVLLLANNRESSVLSSSEVFAAPEFRLAGDGVANCIMAFSKGEKNSSDGDDLKLKFSAGCSVLIIY